MQKKLAKKISTTELHRYWCEKQVERAFLKKSATHFKMKNSLPLPLSPPFPGLSLSIYWSGPPNLFLKILHFWTYSTDKQKSGDGRDKRQEKFSVSDPDSIRSADPYPDPDPGGQKLPIKIGKNSEISRFEVLNILFWGLKTSSVAWTAFMEA